jgi:hypothetical protein
MDEQRCGLCQHFQGEYDWGPCTIFQRDVSGYSGQHCRRYQPYQPLDGPSQSSTVNRCLRL